MQTTKLAASSPAPSTLRRWAIPTGVPATPASAASRPGEPGDTGRGWVRGLGEGVAPAQVALAWVYARASRLGVPIVPIPGTKRVKWLEQNVGALAVTLTPGSWPPSTRWQARPWAPGTDACPGGARTPCQPAAY
jgi:Aldo/keto reductase family